MFSCEICETFKNTYFEEHPWTTVSATNKLHIDIRKSIFECDGTSLPKQATTTNHHERPQTTTNHQQATTNYQQTNTNYQQTTTNDHPCTSNQKSDVLFLLPLPGNYQEHPDLKKHNFQCQISGEDGGRWWFRTVGWVPTKVSIIN